MSRGPEVESSTTQVPAQGASLRRWLAMPLILLVRIYQRLISPLLPPSCKYYPSCSAYAVTALERFGPVKGTWLALRRLGRCNPWSDGGVDHVPARPGEHLDDLGRPHPGPARQSAEATDMAEPADPAETAAPSNGDPIAPGHERTGPGM